MFADDKNIDTLEQLLVELKRYAGLQAEYRSLQLVQKLTVLLSTLILVLVLLILGIMALFYLSFTMAYVMAPAVGGLSVSYGIITAFILLLIVGIAVFRQQLIVRPLVRFLTGLFLDDEPSDENIRAKRDEVEASSDRMAGQMQTLFERKPVADGAMGWIHHVQTGIAVYDGVRTGIKLMRRLQAAFGKRHRRKK
jgi:uncharacterized membrane protein (DUF485 family)